MTVLEISSSPLPERIPLDIYGEPVLPRNIRAWCHICNNGRGFESIDACQEHIRDVHRIWKG